MSKNTEELKAKIAELEQSIQEMEIKRMRSSAAILEAVIDKTEPRETEVKIFKTLSRIIEGEGNELRMLKEELDKNQ